MVVAEAEGAGGRLSRHDQDDGVDAAYFTTGTAANADGGTPRDVLHRANLRRS